MRCEMSAILPAQQRFPYLVLLEMTIYAFHKLLLLSFCNIVSTKLLRMGTMQLRDHSNHRFEPQLQVIC